MKIKNSKLRLEQGIWDPQGTLHYCGPTGRHTVVDINKKSVRRKSVNVLFFSYKTEEQLPCKCHCAATLVLPQYIQGMLVEGPVRKATAM